MGYGIKYRVEGDYACFTRPEMKVERVSYDVITPSAARGIIEAIYWKPAIAWVIDKIHVLKPIEFTNIRRNEVNFKTSVDEARRRLNGSADPFYLDASATDSRTQRSAMVLKNVDYVIEAHFNLVPDQIGPSDTVEKHYNIVLRRLRKGQYFQAPCLGTREFGARVTIVEEGPLPVSAHTGMRDLGWMLYDIDYSNPADIRAQFFKAEMRDGLIDLTQVQFRS